MAATQKNTSSKLAACGTLLMHLGEEDEFISKTAQAQIKAALAKNRTQQFTVIRVSVTRIPGTMGRITMPPRQRWRTDERANFSIYTCGDLTCYSANVRLWHNADILTGSPLPKVLETIWRQLTITNRVLNVLMPEMWI
jgi:hypothetical protein